MEILLLRTLVLSDRWSAYHRVRQELGLNHRMVNHSRNFVDPVRANVRLPNGRVARRVPVHTQNVERFNGLIKAYIKRFYGTNAAQHEEMMYEALFWV